MNHPEHICRFNDAPQTCECYDAGYEKAAKESREKTIEEIKEWARLKKDQLTMKWDRDKAQSTVYDLIIFGDDDFPGHLNSLK